MVVGEEIRQNPAEIILVQHDHMVQAFTAEKVADVPYGLKTRPALWAMLAR